jgi:hypothetical protein
MNRANRVLQVLLAMQKVEGSNPFSRFKKAAICRSFSLRQPASASASPCTQCGPARLDVPVGAEKDCICRSFADDRTTDLLRGARKVKGSSRAARVSQDQAILSAPAVEKQRSHPGLLFVVQPRSATGPTGARLRLHRGESAVTVTAAGGPRCAEIASVTT